MNGVLTDGKTDKLVILCLPPFFHANYSCLLIFTCCPKEQSGSKCRSTLLNSSCVLPGVDSFQECIKRYFPLIDQCKHTVRVGVWEERSHTLEYFPLHIQNSYTGGGYIELALLSGTEKLA